MRFAISAPMASPRRADNHDALARRVLAYLELNDGAMDSLEGIARFWLHEEPAVVAPCLEDLHARGRLEVRTIAGVPYYTRPSDGGFEAFRWQQDRPATTTTGVSGNDSGVLQSRPPRAPLDGEAERHYAESLSRLIIAAEDLHEETFGHTRRVVRLAGAVGRTLRLPAEALDALHRAALLHELGRTVLGLTSSERLTFCDAAMPDATDRLLAPIAGLRTALHLLRAAAVRFEEGPQRPIESDILAVIEEFVRRVPADASAAAAQQAVFSLTRRPGQCAHREVLTALGDLITMGDMA